MTTYTVINSNDSGAGSLRDGINGTDPFIIFDPVIISVSLVNAELLVNRSVTITGRLNAASLSIVMTTNNARVFNIGDGINPITVFISGLTVTTGNAPSGAGINVAGNATVELDNIIVSNNISNGVNPTDGGGGINVDNGTNVIISNSIITANQAAINGGGINVINGSLVSLINSNVTLNSAGFDGGGVYNSGSVIAISTTTISQNSCLTNGGGVNIIDSIDCSITDSLIALNSNSTTGNGGGINIANSAVIISTTTIDQNNSVNDGGGCNILDSSIVSFRDCIITSNAADEFNLGGGISADSSVIILLRTTVNGNSSGSGRGVGTINSLTNITDSTISNNFHPDPDVTGSGGGIFISDPASVSLINNSTISGNLCTTGGGIFVIGPTAPVTLLNVTISNNIAFVGGGISVDATIITAIVNVGNTIIADNIVGAGGNPDVDGTCVSNGNNLIGDGTGSTGFINGVNGDQVGTSATPIDPVLGPLFNYGGPTETMALLPGSPAIDTGNNALNPPGNFFDQRGPPFRRISPLIGGTIDIGAFEFQQVVICYSGKSKILAKNKLTGEINEVNADEIIAGTHEVYNMTNNCFVPVKLNIVSGFVNHFMLIKKDLLGINQPSEDFYVTPGHMIMINGKETKARDIIQAIKITTEPQKVYSICTTRRYPIMINGLDVMTWRYDKWMSYAKKQGISWINNKLIKQNNNNCCIDCI